MTRPRKVLAVTNSHRIADALEATARAAFASVERGLTLCDRHGWLVEITVDADEYDRWIAS